MIRRNKSKKQLNEPLYKIRRPKGLVAQSELEDQYETFTHEFNAESEAKIIMKTRKMVQQFRNDEVEESDVQLFSQDQRSLLRRIDSLDSLRAAELRPGRKEGWQRKRLNLLSMNHSIEVSKQLSENITPSSAYAPSPPPPAYNIFDTLAVPMDRSKVDESYRLKGNDTNNTISQYDIWDGDRPDEEWWEWCRNSPKPHALCPFYTEGVYLRRPVEVIGFNPETRRFTVHDHESSFQKEVMRLSLCFKIEDEDKYMQRVELCKMRQKAAEVERRFTKYVDSVALTQISSPTEQFKKRVMMRAAKRSQPGDIRAQDLKMLKSYLPEVELQYVRYLKKFLVLDSMARPGNKTKWQQLRITNHFKPKLFPQHGRVCQPRYGFSELRDHIKERIIQFKDVVVYNTFKQINERRSSSQQFVLVDLKLSPQNTVALGDFQQRQEEHFALNLHNLMMQMREFVISNIMDQLGHKYMFYQTSPRDYYASQLPRLIKCIDEMLCTFLRQDLLHRNLNLWRRFIKRFVAPDVGCETAGFPLLFLTMNVNERVQHQREKKKKKKKDKEKDKEEEEEELQGELIFFEPSIQKVVEIFNQPINKIEAVLNRMFRIEPEVVPLIEMDKFKPCIDMEQERQFLAESKAEMEKYIELAYQEAEVILAKFKRYGFLLDGSCLKTIKGLFKEAGQLESLNKEEIEAQMVALDAAVRQIPKIEINERKTSLFLIQTKTIKDLLIKNAQEQMDFIVDKVIAAINLNVHEANRKYDELRTDLSNPLRNEQGLQKLLLCIAEHDMHLGRLRGEVSLIEKYMEFVQRYRRKFDYNMFFGLYAKPSEVKEAVLEGNMNSNNARIKFQVALDNEKELFNKEIVDIKERHQKIKDLQVFDYRNNYMDEVKAASEFEEKLQEGLDKAKKFNERERIFEQPETDYDELDKISESFQPYLRMWRLISKFQSDKYSTCDEPISKLNAKAFHSTLKKNYEEALRSIKEFEELDDPKYLEIAEEVKKDIAEYKEISWLIDCLTIEIMQQQKKGASYWKQIFKECGITDLEFDDNLNLRKLLDKKIEKHRGAIEEICSKADKQFQLQKKITEMTDRLKEKKIELIPYKATGLHLVKGVDELIAYIEEQQGIINTMKSSPYIKPLMSKANTLEGKMLLIEHTLEMWVKCQRSWMYLEPIFSSEDIKTKLAAEKAKFDLVDAHLRNTVKTFLSDPLVDQIESDKLKTEFENDNESLEEIQKSLSEYLETKRRYFPRFFFLSDEELLEILAQTKDPFTVQKHISKCFEAISQLIFNKAQHVTGMTSTEKESVTYLKNIDVNEGEKKGNVEIWLKEIELVMIRTLKKITQECEADEDTERNIWIRKYQAQCILGVNMIRWTRGVQEVLMRRDTSCAGVHSYLEFLEQQLRRTVDMVRMDLTELERLTLGALVVIDVHARDVVQELANRHISSETEFEWIAQLRYYSQVQGKNYVIKVRMINAELLYGFEYLGNSSRLVITPLTDRCYRTLMGAFHLYYGGAPEGPAGTGKTETVKDLAKAMAVPCVVFNCSDGLNYLAMRKFFKGLAASGSWCCFDEFNRIDLEVLSVIAQQVLSIQNAVKEKRKKFLLDGEEIQLIPSCAINITMNPGYAGRSELPDNLKALFRPCAMMVPDYALISEIYLYSVGFQEARSLARKVVASLKLSSEQLSSQDHYDFGMRALKAILTASGNLKRVMAQSEEIICLRALNDVNIPKFTINDVPLFNSITSDLFPGVVQPPIDYGLIQQALNLCAEQKHLTQDPKFIAKCIQLYDTINVRHGLMLVGQAFSGKSTIIQLLRLAYCSLQGNPGFVGAKCKKLNPKAITSDQLYGKLDPITRSWFDGVIAIIMREFSQENDVRERKWVIFDGPVDAVWIQNMNTVLDDNKKLCLTSGQIIKLTSWMTMMFEVEDLAQASPATVSRCGMVFLESKQLEWLWLVNSFIELLPEQLEKRIEAQRSVLTMIVDCSLAFVRKYGKFLIHRIELNLVDSFLKILKSQLLEVRKDPSKIPKDFDDALGNFMMFAAVWSFGAAVEEVSRKKYAQFMLKLITADFQIVENYQLELTYAYKPFSIKAKLPDKVNLLDMCYIYSRGWTTWSQTRPPYVIPKGGNYSDIKVPTSDSLRNSHLMQLLVASGFHLLIAGPTGTGKTSNVLAVLQANYFNANYTYLNTSFSGQTTANQVQRILESKINLKKKKNMYGPEDRKNNIVVFIDDLSMPIKEKYGAQPPIQLLRQWMDMGGWYDLDTKQFKEMIGIIWVAAMLPPSGGRNTLTSRYLRHYNLLYAQTFENDSLLHIFSTIMEWYFTSLPTPYSKAITNLSEVLVKSTIQIYNSIQVSKELLPTPAKSHYIYNLRDISKVFQGMTKASAKGVRDENAFIKLWLHQVMRVFKDRLINFEDQAYFDSMLKQVVLVNLRRDWSQTVTVEPLLFASFIPILPVEGGDGKKLLRDVYCQLFDREIVKKKCYRSLEEYSAFTGNKLNLVLFTAAIENIIKIVRVLQTSLGHLLLVGVGGSGRKSLARLGNFIAFNCESFEINEKNWVEELQKLMRMLGLDGGKQMAFIYNDGQILRESMLQDICNLLNIGQIPNLFNKEERSKVAEESNFNGLENEKFQAFLNKCKENLHLVLCMSPVGEDWRARLRTFPSLVNCTTINWFLPWPEEALRSIAQNHLVNEMRIKEVQLASSLVEICVDMQVRVRNLSTQYYNELRRYYYVTPTSYLELLNIFQTLLAKRKKIVGDLISNYETGVDKIDNTQLEVARMKLELTALQPKLVQSTEDNKIMLANLTKKRKQADGKKAVCEADEKVCSLQREEANKLMIECQSNLDRVRPILEEAVKSLDSVASKDLDFLKSMASPPVSGLIVFQCLCYALNEDSQVKWVTKPDSTEKVQDFWSYSKKYLLNGKALQRIKSFGINNGEKILEVPSKQIQKLSRIIDRPEFDKSKLEAASSTILALGMWIRAIVNSYKALLVVKPKEAELKDSKLKLEQAERVLSQKKEQLQEVMDLLNKLEKDYFTAKKEKEDLELKITKVKNQLQVAEKLTTGLKGEKESWRKRAKDFREEEKNIVGDILLCSGVIAYLGAFPTSYREVTMQNWKKLMDKEGILYSKDCSLQKVLSDPITIGKWTNQEKLPNDSFSIDNAIIFHNSSRWPLMIDPQNQAANWIRATYQPLKTLHILKPSQDEATKSRLLELAISSGQQLLMINMGETIDSLFEPVFMKKLIKKGISYQIKVGVPEKLIDWDPNFKFLMTTKLSRPHYSPDVCVKVTMLNFQVTLEGLEDQMLNIVVRNEEPMKEEQRLKNIRQFFENKAKQKANEDLILSMLYNSEKNILEDDQMIKMLEKSKNDSSEVEEKLKKQEYDKEQFNIIRNFYAEVAKRVANLYFVVLDLALIEPTYQWSLEFYTALFEMGISKSPPGKDNRCLNISKTFTEFLYESISRSLLAKDKLIFSLTMCLKALLSEGKITTPMVRYVMMGGATVEEMTGHPPEGRSWITNKMWASIQAFGPVFGLPSFADDFAKEVDEWQLYYNDSSSLWTGKLPKRLKGMQPFMKLSLIRVLKPQKFIEGCQNLIIEIMGKKYIEPPAFNLESAILESNNQTPLIFILSPGADPRLQITFMAETMGFKNNFEQISLGQGQEQIATNAFKKASEEGLWLLLQNCHLAPSMMPRLQKLVEENTNVHSNFRLWLTSMPSSVFPVNILMRGIKMTYEPPRGLKTSLLRSLSLMDSKSFEDCKKPGEWKKLFFGLSFFHALILERRKFGPLGWNIPYEFTMPDFTISMNQLKMFLNEWEEIPWEALNYMVAEANYGGRVTDPSDRRLIKTILKEFYSEHTLADQHKIFGCDTYVVPLPGNLESFFESVKSFPLNDRVQVFGLHQNAEITFALLQTSTTCEVVLSLLPRNTGAGGASQEEIIKSKIQNMLKKLPELFDVEAAAKKHPVQYEQSMNTVLQQELIRFNKLLGVVRSSMVSLDKAIDGLVVFSADLEIMSDTLFDNKVPQLWHKVSYPSVKPLGSWINDLIERLSYMAKWVSKGKPPSYWISGFFFTQSFLTGILQNYSRAHKIPIDTLHFNFTVKQDLIPEYLEKGPDDGCYCHGLFLDGARWNDVSNCLVDPVPRVLNSEMPVIWFRPTSEAEVSSESEYLCPVYKTSQRRGVLSTTGHSTNFVLSIKLPILKGTDSDFWIKRGTALLTQLDD